eukprot:scaffold1117_cov167-Amphora_coffeaeformis.AAC.22
MVMRRSVSLPKWATLVTHAPSVGEEPLSLVEEEAYVRTRCYHEASQALDRAWKQTLERSSSSEIHPNIFNTKKEPSCDETSRHPPRKRSRTESGLHGETVTHNVDPATDIQQKFSMKPQGNFRQQMLPLHLLSGPTNALDRLAWMKHLVDSARRETDGAIIWLQRGPPSTWVTEIIRQLYIMEPPSETVGLKQLSVIENLERWCRSTQNFRSIQIFLDAQTVGSTAPPMNQFLNWLAHIRSAHRVPFSVILFESSGLRRHDLCSHAQVNDGIVLHRHALATPTILLTETLLNPLVADMIPVLFQGETANGNTSLWSLFESTGSTVLALAEWKRLLANFLSTPGSFLTLDFGVWMSNRRLDWILEPKHLELSKIFTDSGFDLDAWRGDAMTKRTMAVLAWQVRHIVAHDCRAHPPTELWKNIADRKRFVEPVAKARALAAANNQNSRLLAPLNELIVLLDNCPNLYEILQCLDFIEDDWSTFADNLPLRVPLTGQSRLAQPRRDLVEGLLVDEDEDVNGLSSVPGILYSVFNHRVSVSLSEWMQSFIDDERASQQMDPSEAVATFSVGINFLKIQGLIRERRAGGKTDTIFEKTAVVFSSGA